jgi:microcystin-dependent protein
MLYGQVRLFAGNFAPEGWAICDGATLQIANNRDLFNDIGTRFGGDGRTTFALPDLRGRAPIHRADGAAVGTKGKFSIRSGDAEPYARVALNCIIPLRGSDLLDYHQPFLGEVRPFGFNFAPRDWLACDGALLPVSEYVALFYLLSNQYGGDGTRTFAVPDLQGAYPFQPEKPEGRGQKRGSQVSGNPSQQTPLLAINYCICVNGLFPQRPS